MIPFKARTFIYLWGDLALRLRGWTLELPFPDLNPVPVTDWVPKPQHSHLRKSRIIIVTIFIIYCSITNYYKTESGIQKWLSWVPLLQGLL